MINCNSLNQCLTIEEKAKEEFLNLFKKIDQELVGLDTQCLLMPGDISRSYWTETFGFSSEFKRALSEKYSGESKAEDHGLNHMNRDALENFILDNGLNIDSEDYKDEPLEDLLDAVKQEVEDLDKEDDKKVNGMDCKFEEIGLYAWKPGDSESAVISVYIEMDSDDSTWPLIKNVASVVEGKIILHHDSWEFNHIICKDFNLSEDLDPKKIAEEVVVVAQKILVMAKGIE